MYLLQLLTKLESSGIEWEAVDKYVYQNHKKAVLKDGSRRYTDARASWVDGRLEIEGTFDKRDAAIIMRVLGINTSDSPPKTANGFVFAPEYIKVATKNGKFRIYENTAKLAA